MTAPGGLDIGMPGDQGEIGAELQNTIKMERDRLAAERIKLAIEFIKQEGNRLRLKKPAKHEHHDLSGFYGGG